MRVRKTTRKYGDKLATLCTRIRDEGASWQNALLFGELSKRTMKRYTMLRFRIYRLEIS